MFRNKGEETCDVVVNYKHQGLFGKHTHCIICTIIFMYPYLRCLKYAVLYSFFMKKNANREGCSI